MNKNDLFNYIEERIYGNNNGAITGPILQDVLKKIVEFNSERGCRQGKDGVGIDSITKTRGSDAQGTYTQLIIKTTDNRTTPFKVYDGSDGADGAQGPRGASGRDGINGTDGSDGRDGRDGEDGRDGKDGKDGQDGFQGRKGAAIRGPYDFYSMSSTTRWWCNGEESEAYPDSVLWIDIILKDEVYYYCNTTYYGKLSPWNNVRQNWTAGESYEFIATKILLARNAKINFLTNNELYLMDANGRITGGAAGGDGINFWAGAEHPSNGKFRVYADGRLVATNAQIKGAITATSLTLRGADIENYIHNEVDDALNGFEPGDAVDENQVNDLIRQYLMTVDYVKPSDLNGYFNETKLREWFRNNYSAMTEDQIEEIVRRMVSAETSSVEIERMPDGSLKHTAYIGNNTYVWYTYDAGKYMLIDTEVSGWNGDKHTRFVVDQNGLLTAENAFVSGKIYASEGWFKGRLESQDGFFRGSVSADNGYFHGDIVANSLMLGSQSIQDYVSSKVSAATGSEGITTDDVNRLIDEALSGQNWVVMDDLGDYLKLGVKLGNQVSSVTISKQGLLVAKNAIVSGTVFANDGIFNGTVHANDGYFHGDVVARSLTLGDNQSFEDFVNGKIASAITSGMDEETIAEIINQHIGSGGNWVILEDLGDSLGLGVRYGNGLSSITISKQGLLVAKNAIVSGTVFANDGIFNGTVYANDGYFNGAVSATSLYLGRDAVVSGTVYATKGKFENISADNITIKNSNFSGTVYANSGVFKGNVYANNGYFKGDITANSLTLGSDYGNESFDDYLEAKITSAVTSGLNPEQINRLINDYITTSGITMDGYLTEDNFSGWLETWNLEHSGETLTWEQISALTKNLIGAEVSNSLSSKTNSDGSVTTQIKIGNKTWAWDTYDAGDYLIIDTEVGNGVFTSAGSNNSPKFVVERDGLMKAKNAWVQGTVFATNGYFRGAISATSLWLDDNCAEQIEDALNLDDYYQVGDTLSYESGIGNAKSSVTISNKGLLIAKNAVISGNVYATDGVFRGDVYANNGSFKGSVSAETGYFSNGIRVGSPTGDTFENYINSKIGVSTVTTFRGEYDSAKYYYGSQERSDIVKYNSLYYKSKVDAPQTVFRGILPTNSGYWSTFGTEFESIATDYAFINDLVVRKLNTAGDDSSKRIVAMDNELTMYDSGNSMHLRVTGDEISLDSSSVSFPTLDNNDYFTQQATMGYDDAPITGHSSMNIKIARFSLPSANKVYSVVIPRIKVNAVENFTYSSDIDHLSYEVYYENSYGQGRTVLSTLRNYNFGEVTLYGGGTLHLERTGQAQPPYDLYVRVEFDWYLENAIQNYGVTCEASLDVYDVTNGSIFILGSEDNVVSIGANGMAINFGTFSAIFGMNNGSNIIELKGVGNGGNMVGLKLDSDGLKLSTDGTWKTPVLQ